MYEHGDITLSWEDDLLIIYTHGVFNEAGLQLAVNKIKKSIANKNISLWRRLEIWAPETLGSPSVVAIAKETSKWYQKNGCYASAMVVHNSIQSHIIQSITHTDSIIFSDKNDALLWLNKQTK